jgi:hypothetical protein
VAALALAILGSGCDPRSSPPTSLATSTSVRSVSSVVTTTTEPRKSRDLPCAVDTPLDNGMVDEPCVSAVRSIPWVSGRISKGGDLILIFDEDAMDCVGLVSIGLLGGSGIYRVDTKGGRLRDPKDCSRGEVPLRIVFDMQDNQTPPRHWKLIDGVPDG